MKFSANAPVANQPADNCQLKSPSKHTHVDSSWIQSRNNSQLNCSYTEEAQLTKMTQCRVFFSMTNHAQC